MNGDENNDNSQIKKNEEEGEFEQEEHELNVEN
jgi:hypothetical protein